MIHIGFILLTLIYALLRYWVENGIEYDFEGIKETAQLFVVCLFILESVYWILGIFILDQWN